MVCFNLHIYTTTIKPIFLVVLPLSLANNKRLVRRPPCCVHPQDLRRQLREAQAQAEEEAMSRDRDIRVSENTLSSMWCM